MDAWTQLTLLAGPLTAFVLSGVLGWEREAKHKSAGLRTHMLVGVSSALFVVLSEAIVQVFANNAPQVRFDVIRVLSAVVSGVSFLGAGVTFSSRRRARGLTTAASLLASASVGVACGLHLYVLATAVTLLFWIILSPLSRLTDRLSVGPSEEEQD